MICEIKGGVFLVMLHKSKRSNAEAYCGLEKLLLYATMLNHQTRESHFHTIFVNIRVLHCLESLPFLVKHGMQLSLWVFLALVPEILNEQRFCAFM